MLEFQIFTSKETCIVGYNSPHRETSLKTLYLLQIAAECRKLILPSIYKRISQNLNT